MNLEGKTVAVTGASGMIGVYICRSLLKAGARVIGVVRNPQKAAFLSEEGVEFRKADLNDRDSLQTAFEGCDVVVSNAALYVVKKSMSAWAEHEKANMDGTRNVIEAASLARVPRVIHISTFGIYKWSIFRVLNEESPQLNGVKRQGGAYRATKQASEDLAWNLAGQNDIQLTTLRPTAVFGARDNNFLRPVYSVLKMPLLLLPSISFPVVYAGDVANAVVGAVSNPSSSGKAYNVGGAKRQIADFFDAVYAVVEKRPPTLSIRLPISVKIDNSRAEQELGFSNRPFIDAMREIIADEHPPKHLSN